MDEVSYSILKNAYLSLQAENEQIKKDYAKLHIDFAQCNNENERLKALYDTYRTCYQAKHSDIKCLFPKYKQALQDIRDIVNKRTNTQSNTSKTLTVMAQDIIRIQDKINEVIGGDNG